VHWLFAIPVAHSSRTPRPATVLPHRSTGLQHSSPLGRGYGEGS